MRAFSLVLAALLVAAPAAAASKMEQPKLSLSGANFRPLPMAIAPVLYPAATSNRAAGQEIDDTLQQDLTVSGLFELLDRASFLAKPNEGVAATGINFASWQDVGAEALVKVVVTDKDPLTAEFHLYNAITSSEELSKKYTGPASDARRMAHRFADEIFKFYTREPGAFQTALAFVRKVSGNKQVFVADWDGRNARPLTQGAMNLLPAWSADGKRLAFTSYRGGQPELWAQDLGGGKAGLLFKRGGSLITGASFSQDGKRVAFSVSEEDGNSHIWVASATGQNAKKLTEGFGINSSPSFSPDGKQIAFVSNRAGNPQIYVIGADGGAPKRITFQGNYNQTPDWSPRGDLIAFTARDERNVFDLFTVDPASTKIARLTQDQGNNEEPSFSPNGRLIAFTSTRTGKSQLFVMSSDGNFQKQMTSGDEVFTPSWGPFKD